MGYVNRRLGLFVKELASDVKKFYLYGIRNGVGCFYENKSNYGYNRPFYNVLSKLEIKKINQNFDY